MKKDIVGVFIVSMKSDALYYYSLKAGKSGILFRGGGYASKWGYKGGIDFIKVYANDDAMFDRKISSEGKYYFNLKQPNGRILGESKLYNTAEDREKGIDIVKKTASKAVIRLKQQDKRLKKCPACTRTISGL